METGYSRNGKKISKETKCILIKLFNKILTLWIYNIGLSRKKKICLFFLLIIFFMFIRVRIIKVMGLDKVAIADAWKCFWNHCSSKQYSSISNNMTNKFFFLTKKSKKNTTKLPLVNKTKVFEFSTSFSLRQQ